MLVLKEDGKFDNVDQKQLAHFQRSLPETQNITWILIGQAPLVA
jgi:hypothetical protein